MRIPIIYGNSRYCRKKVKPQDLGILAPLENIQHFELTQTYAHLYMIPMFPTGSAWHARGKDGKLYEINEGVLPHLEEVGSPWYSILLAFLGPITILVALGWYSGSKAYSEHKWEVSHAAEIKKAYEDRMSYINHPAIQDYYDFDEGNRSEHAKVIGFNDTAVELSIMRVDRNKMADFQVMHLITDTTETPYTDWISKRDLMEIAKDDNVRKEIPLLGAGSFHIYTIMRLGEPILEHGGTANTNAYAIGIRNRGKYLIITSVTGATPYDSLPGALDFDNSFYFDMPEGLGGEPFTFSFTCKDEAGKTFSYQVKGKKTMKPEIEIIKLP